MPEGDCLSMQTKTNNTLQYDQLKLFVFITLVIFPPLVI
jgi:nitrate reductase NapE component